MAQQPEVRVHAQHAPLQVLHTAHVVLDHTTQLQGLWAGRRWRWCTRGRRCLRCLQGLWVRRWCGHRCFRCCCWGRCSGRSGRLRCGCDSRRRGIPAGFVGRAGRLGTGCCCWWWWWCCCSAAGHWLFLLLLQLLLLWFRAGRSCRWQLGLKEERIDGEIAQGCRRGKRADNTHGLDTFSYRTAVDSGTAYGRTTTHAACRPSPKSAPLLPIPTPPHHHPRPTGVPGGRFAAPPLPPHHTIPCPHLRPATLPPRQGPACLP